MRILIVGSGGREHALAWVLRKAGSLYIAPGNAGTAGLGTNVPIAAENINGVVEFAYRERIDLTVVGPEIPLAFGLVDVLKARGKAVFGPSAAAAEIESSKAFAKAFMQRHNIPTAEWRVFESDQISEARAYSAGYRGQCVVKASGLAAGKGAIVCDSQAESDEALKSIMVDGQFGNAGQQVIVEERMEGEEVSLFALTDGEDYVMLAAAQDHKQIYENDQGPNTGGMGAYAPAPVATAALMETARRRIIEPVLEGMASEGRLYTGCLYAGLMMTEFGPKVVEFNCRFGDPEAQVVLPLIEADCAEVLLRSASGGLGNLRVPPASRAAACIVLASEGYPGAYQKGRAINGLRQAEDHPGVVVLHAGTDEVHGRTVTSGGRVLGVTAIRPTLEQAFEMAYTAAECIDYRGCYYRRDIGHRVRQL
ncbi:MAG: phosphoribosylamine--glycine ligase [Bacteroidota bacterium]|nr:phosphoribosylamine--glycine ligase [Bacteroidota bacterium]